MIKKVRIAVDHGNRNMKTCSQVFTTGLTIQDKKPARGEKFLFYEGKYYVLSENRIPYQRDKTQDDRFFILTLFAIVKELEENPLIQPEDVIQVDLPIGLPPKHYAELCERYESYFKRQGKIHDINYCGSTYHITICYFFTQPGCKLLQGSVCFPVSDTVHNTVVFLLPASSFWFPYHLCGLPDKRLSIPQQYKHAVLPW